MSINRFFKNLFKINRIQVLLFLLVCSLFFISAKKEKAKPVLQYSESITNLISLLEEWYQSTDTEKDSEYLTKARRSFKEWEWILEYLDMEWHQLFNGAPVTDLVKGAAGVYEKPPSGFQYLEEMICNNAGKEEIKPVIKELLIQSKMALERYSTVELTSLQCLEAIQLSLIRIQTLTIKGFENPCNAKSESLKEGVLALQAISDFIQLNRGKQKLFSPIERENLRNQISLISKTLESTDFENLDRYSLIVQYFPKLNKMLETVKWRYQKEKSFWKFNSPVKLNAASIFDPEFINQEFFARYGQGKSSPEIVSLGKILFFDPILSGNNQMSCATCHIPDKYFADGLVKSKSAHESHTLKRNTPSLFYTGFQSRWMYSMHARFLEDQMDHVIISHQEFGTSYTEIVQKLQKSETYSRMFSQAFQEVTEQAISVYSINLALASYVRTLAPFNSDFDNYITGESSVPQSVKNGFNLFTGKAKCATCHFLPHFNGLQPPYYRNTEAEVLGIYSPGDTTVLDADLGRFLSEPLADFKRAFKTPGLRNIEMTAPYGHNGCFSDLKSIMTFYNQGGGVGYGFDIENQTLSAEKLNLSSTEIKDIIAFLTSLTDKEIGY